jgi:hypothetical protein
MNTVYLNLGIELDMKTKVELFLITRASYSSPEPSERGSLAADSPQTTFPTSVDQRTRRAEDRQKL